MVDWACKNAQFIRDKHCVISLCKKIFFVLVSTNLSFALRINLDVFMIAEMIMQQSFFELRSHFTRIVIKASVWNLCYPCAFNKVILLESLSHLDSCHIHTIHAFCFVTNTFPFTIFMKMFMF